MDGVRGIAIAAVLLFHFGSLYAPLSPGTLDTVLRRLPASGWVGVALFFVLSGFLITGILLDARGSRHYFPSFYMRRVLRIFPLYYGVLLVVFVLVPLATHHQFVAPARQIAFWLHASNWTTAFDPFAPLVTNFWTLSVEEQFYLVWPAAIAFIPRRAHLPLCIALLLTPLVLRNIPYLLRIQAAHPDFMYRLTPFRVDTLAAGALVAILVRSRHRFPSLALPAALAGAGIIAALLVNARGQFSAGAIPVVRFGYTAVLLLCSALVLYAYQRRGSAGTAWLRTRALTGLGKYSYGIYVFHGIVRYFLPHLTAHLPPTRMVQASVAAFGIALSLAISFASFHLYEKQFLRLKTRFPY